MHSIFWTTIHQPCSIDSSTDNPGYLIKLTSNHGNTSVDRLEREAPKAKPDGTADLNHSSRLAPRNIYILAVDLNMIQCWSRVTN